MDVGANPYELAALVFAPVAALATIRVSRRWHLALVVIIVGLLGFALLAASVAWTDARLGAIFDAMPNPSPEQMREFSADGASKAAFFLFGFPASLIYAATWFLLVRIGRAVARRVLHA